MDCGIILFIYDRPQCTEKVLEALKRNQIDEIYIFQDGLGEKTDKYAWKKNEDIIKQIDWCKVIYEQNEYKASSLDSQIIYGINKVFKQKDAIIVIEDDCVISDDCIQFMEKCLINYQNNEKIIDVGAYLEPIKIPEEYALPVIGAGIPAGQVWGTWKNRWEEFHKDFYLIRRIGNSLRNNPMFQSCGYPIRKILIDYAILSTWDLWWSIYVLLKEGISIRPTGNKVYNIGFENPGTHTAGNSPWVVPICDMKDSMEELPQDIKIETWAEKEFKKFYQKVNDEKTLEEKQTYYRNCLEKWLELKQQGKSIADILLEKNIKKAAIYGIGSIGKLLLDDLSKKIRIMYCVVTDKKTDTFMQYSVYDCNEELPEDTDQPALIVIPGYDLEKIKERVGKNFTAVYPIDELCAFEA